MQYRDMPPARALAPFIECLWMLEGEPDAFANAPERILPDGCVEIILSFGAPFAEIGAGKKQLQPAHFLVGQMTQPVIISPTGSVRLIGIRFHPGGTFPFLRAPMHQTTDRIIELDAIASDLRREFVEAAAGAPSLMMKAAVFQRVLARRLRNCGRHSRMVELTAQIVRSAGQVSVDRLATEAGLSARQLRRRFMMEVGIGPKLLCRLLRFQQVFKAVESNMAEWSSVALECGYYDQAHLINDFRQFAQQTPAVLLAHSGGLTEAFTRKRRVSDFSNISSLTAS